MALRERLQVQCFLPSQKPQDRVPHRQPHNFQPFRVGSSKFGVLLSTTHQAFDEIPLSDTFGWNTLIQNHISDGDPEQAMLIYQQMLLRGVRLDKHTFPRILTASRLSGSLFYGKQIHGQALKLGFGPDDYVLSALMAMYGHLDSADTAQCLFNQSPHKNKVCWTLLVGLYIKEDKPKSAIDTFLQMVSLGFEIDDVALVTVSGACGHLKSLPEGRKVHEIARNLGLESNALVSNALLKMYIDCNSIKDARLVFDQMSSKDAISWTSIVRGYVKSGGYNEGLKLFRSMNFEGIKPDSLTVSSVLPACARMSASKHGKEIHGYIIRNNIKLNVTVQNAMMDMYAKSGCLEYASEVFARMREKDAISWTIMILGSSLNGQGELAVELFREVEKYRGVEPDQIMYVAALHACCTARMVEEGKSYFNYIRAPKADQYALMVALLAHAGHFDEARDFIEEYQIERYAEVQLALLNGCRLHRNMNIGKRVIDKLIELEPLNAENYVVLSNFYVASGKLDMVISLREVIRDMGLKPMRAYSWIEVQNKFHVFGVGDVSHPRSVRIYEELQGLMKKMEEQEGFMPDADFSFHDVDEERECIPIGHSEMLAISFGLISTQGRATIRVTKSLRVCRNCHNSAKFITKIVGREIILKDPNYFHHFKDGLCSCGDFW